MELVEMRFFEDSEEILNEEFLLEEAVEYIDQVTLWPLGHANRMTIHEFWSDGTLTAEVENMILMACFPASHLERLAKRWNTDIVSVD